MAVAAAVFLWPTNAQAQTQSCAKVGRDNLAPCALAASLVVRGEAKLGEALEGRRVANGIVLPANPVLSFSAAQRKGGTPDQSGFNWYASLSQEIEIGGQRGARVRSADAALDAQEKKVRLSKREAVATAWTAYFEVLAAKEYRALVEELAHASERVGVATKARAERGLAPTLDADLAEVAAVRAAQAKIAALQALASAEAKLKFALGLAPEGSLEAQGELLPLPGLTQATAKFPPISARLEFQSATADQQSMLARAQALRRSRIPSPSVSVFVQNDGFNERVLGLGLALPIPLPAPVGRTYAGEIMEAEALADRAGIERQRFARAIELETVDATNAYQAQLRIVESLSTEKKKAVERSLRDLRTEVEAGRVAVRDAIAAQQAMIELLQNDVSQRKNLCLASVRLALALGVSLEGGSQ